MRHSIHTIHIQLLNFGGLAAPETRPHRIQDLQTQPGPTSILVQRASLRDPQHQLYGKIASHESVHFGSFGADPIA
ncbi:hypothetical protein VDGE_30083 [Verticillium dahliae]|uniref:Uncharacterized protein n=1 Tax=Verticillium dahliae TaxID=27337 RepID=A0A444RVY7_VERDA|nr:hypothetical protein VDGE_30083 [Verticillium dahliae]